MPIPKIIHKTYYYENQDQMPDIYKKIFHQNNLLNPNLKVKYYNNQDCKLFIEKNFPVEVLRAYNVLKAKAYKADLFRMCALYIHGGVYSDFPQKYLCRLDEIINFSSNNVFLCKDKPNNSIQISFIACPKKNILIKYFLDTQIKNIENRIKSYSALGITGPKAIGNAFMKFFKINSVKEIDYVKFPLRQIGNGYLNNYMIIDKSNIPRIKLYNNFYLKKRKKHYGKLWWNRDIYYDKYSYSTIFNKFLFFSLKTMYIFQTIKQYPIIFNKKFIIMSPIFLYFTLKIILFYIFKKANKKSSIINKLLKVKQKQFTENERVSYYNKINTFKIYKSKENMTKIKIFKMLIFHFCKMKIISGIFYEGYLLNLLIKNNVTRSFLYKGGDVSHSCKQPTFTKSRPVNTNYNIIIRLNKWRHLIDLYKLIIDNLDIPFNMKNNKVIWRGTTTGFSNKKGNRFQLMKHSKDNNMFDIGFSKIVQNKWEYKDYIKNKLDIKTQLQSKFLISVEGNDVATGLKWMLYSNSVVLMVKPKIESWFMEDKLEPWKHFVPLKSDYADMNEKYSWCLNNLEKCKTISRNATLFIIQFLNEKKENKIQKLVVQKYKKMVHFTLP